MPLPFPNSSPYSSPEEVWTTTKSELSQRIRRYFARQGPHRRALAYMQGLMSPAERKNGWQVAEEVGEATPYAMQHLLDRAKWDENGIRDELRTYVCKALADQKAILILDETGFLKTGPQMWNLAPNVEQHKHAADKKSPLKGVLVCCMCKFDQPFLGAKAFSLREWRDMKPVLNGNLLTRIGRNFAHVVRGLLSLAWRSSAASTHGTCTFPPDIRKQFYNPFEHRTRTSASRSSWAKSAARELVERRA